MFSHVSSSSQNLNYGQQMLLMKSKIPVGRECKRKEYLMMIVVGLMCVANIEERRGKKSSIIKLRCCAHVETFKHAF